MWGPINSKTPVPFSCPGLGWIEFAIVLFASSIYIEIELERCHSPFKFSHSKNFGFQTKNWDLLPK